MDGSPVTVTSTLSSGSSSGGSWVRETSRLSSIRYFSPSIMTSPVPVIVPWFRKPLSVTVSTGSAAGSGSPGTSSVCPVSMVRPDSERSTAP